MSDWTRYPIYFNAIKKKCLSTFLTWFYLTIIKMNPLRKLKGSTGYMLTTLFYFITIKMNSLTTHSTLFYFTAIELKSLTTLITLFEFTTFKVPEISF